MKKFKAFFATLLFIAVLVAICILTWKGPLNPSDGTPIIPSLIITMTFIIGFWSMIGIFYNWMQNSKKSAKDLSYYLEWYPLPKVLHSDEAGTFKVEEIKENCIVFRFYVNNSLIHAVFMDALFVKEYKKVIIDMGYVEFQTLKPNEEKGD